LKGSAIRNTDALVHGEAMGNEDTIKLRTARDLGAPILTQEEFFAIARAEERRQITLLPLFGDKTLRYVFEHLIKCLLAVFCHREQSASLSMIEDRAHYSLKRHLLWQFTFGPPIVQVNLGDQVLESTATARD
jgi:hypothetical protein